MTTQYRIESIIKANNLSNTITGFQSFDLANLDIDADFDFTLPTNLRLGHLVEKIVSELIKSSSNYTLLYENIQLIEKKQTIGEIDFIVSNNSTRQITHVELAYKFFLYDPSISNDPLYNWIGPNRNDSLKEKLEKLKRKQFPLLHHPVARIQFPDIDTNNIAQSLCFLASLYIPYQFKACIDPIYQHAVKGYFINFKTFLHLNHNDKKYYVPSKTQWGINPADNKEWSELEKIESIITQCNHEKQALLCWQKHELSYSSFFIVWW